jgi:hypothetical protein
VVDQLPFPFFYGRELSSFLPCPVRRFAAYIASWRYTLRLAGH